jgi:hypothetical protein
MLFFPRLRFQEGTPTTLCPWGAPRECWRPVCELHQSHCPPPSESQRAASAVALPKKDTWETRVESKPTHTKCWSLRRCTTRDVQSPMGTRSGDVLYRRSKHRAALCFTLSMVSLEDRHQQSLQSMLPLCQAQHSTKL